MSDKHRSAVFCIATRTFTPNLRELVNTTTSTTHSTNMSLRILYVCYVNYDTLLVKKDSNNCTFLFLAYQPEHGF